MPEITYFQRYSSNENVVTNNVLHFMKRLYQEDPKVLADVLRELSGEERFSVGPTFEQQKRGSANGIIDACITQKAWALYIETKLGGNDHIDQLIRHIKSLSTDSEVGIRVLMALSKYDMTLENQSRVKKEAQDNSVHFVSTTFDKLSKAFEGAIPQHNLGLSEMLSDFNSYLAENNLLEEHFWLPYFPCNESFETNKKFDIYHEPTSRSPKPYKFIGIYAWKGIRLIGEVVARINAYRENNEWHYEPEFGEVTQVYKDRILDITEESPYDLKNERVRYYIVNKFYPTSFLKTTPRGIQGMRYHDLREYIEKYSQNMSAKQIAELLDGKEF